MAASGMIMSSVAKPKTKLNGGNTTILLSAPAMLASRGKRQVRAKMKTAVATAM
jgi:hypothetical protein